MNIYIIYIIYICMYVCTTYNLFATINMNRWWKRRSSKVKSNFEKVSVFAKKTFFALWKRFLFEHPLSLKFGIKTLKISLNAWKSEQTLAIENNAIWYIRLEMRTLNNLEIEVISFIKYFGHKLVIFYSDINFKKMSRNIRQIFPIACYFCRIHLFDLVFKNSII